MQRNKLEMTGRELCVMSAVGSDYPGGGSGLGLAGGSIRLASAEERSCWRLALSIARVGMGAIHKMAATLGDSPTARGPAGQLLQSA